MLTSYGSQVESARESLKNSIKGYSKKATDQAALYKKLLYKIGKWQEAVRSMTSYLRRA